jgi:hypothetical protein
MEIFHWTESATNICQAQRTSTLAQERTVPGRLLLTSPFLTCPIYCFVSTLLWSLQGQKPWWASHGKKGWMSKESPYSLPTRESQLKSDQNSGREEEILILNEVCRFCIWLLYTSRCLSYNETGLQDLKWQKFWSFESDQMSTETCLKFHLRGLEEGVLRVKLQQGEVGR